MVEGTFPTQTLLFGAGGHRKALEKLLFDCGKPQTYV